MINVAKTIIGILFLLSANVVFSEKHHDEKEHKHDEGKHGEEKHGEEKHGEENHGEEKGEHKEAAEENSKIGPNKGILKADERLGFILSPEAIKNFEIKTMKLSGTGPWLVPASARMLSQNEINLFRIRSEYIKRIDFKVHSNQGSSLSVSSSDLSSGDEIIIQGMGFVRIAELAAYGGAPEGHSH